MSAGGICSCNVNDTLQDELSVRRCTRFYPKGYVECLIFRGFEKTSIS